MASREFWCPQIILNLNCFFWLKIPWITNVFSWSRRDELKFKCRAKTFCLSYNGRALLLIKIYRVYVLTVISDLLSVIFFITTLNHKPLQLLILMLSQEWKENEPEHFIVWEMCSANPSLLILTENPFIGKMCFIKRKEKNENVLWNGPWIQDVLWAKYYIYPQLLHTFPNCHLVCIHYALV